jgi:hypothetical protein
MICGNCFLQNQGPYHQVKDGVLLQAHDLNDSKSGGMSCQQYVIHAENPSWTKFQFHIDNLSGNHPYLLIPV